MQQVEIITIGDEILIGQIIDTNSAWLGVELNKQGFSVAQITSIHDQKQHIINALNDALQRANIVLITGGLGPTKDDITKHTLCEYFGSKLIFDEAVYRNIEDIFAKRRYVFNELTRAQALVPECCTVIQNTTGTAPIMWFEHQGKIIVSMPGVPIEMKTAMERDVLPRLHSHFGTDNIIHQTIVTYGIPESSLAIRLTDWENALPEYIKLAYLPNNGIVKLRLSGTSISQTQLKIEIADLVQQLLPLIGENIVAFEDVTLEQQLAKRLVAQGKTMATAESCTGGNVAHTITRQVGSSAYFKGSVVAYANEVKISLLGVSSSDIEKYGAVSQQVVEQMAIGVRETLKTDYAVATSGIAGPDGGTAEKPVGTVWIAVSSAEKTISCEFRFGAQRIQNIDRSTQTALHMLLSLVNNV